MNISIDSRFLVSYTDTIVVSRAWHGTGYSNVTSKRNLLEYAESDL